MSDLSKHIEAILFAAGDPVSKQQLLDALECDEKNLEKALSDLKTALSDQGLQLVLAEGSYSLVTAPGSTEVVSRFLGAQARTELTKPALETLSIIAYKQPATKTQIEEIRGVASDQTIRNLLQRGLIIESGKSNEPGKPIQYSTSHKFLQLLGLSHVGELTPIQELGGDEQTT